MAELSKTARASMGRVVKEVHQETPEEAIRQLRLNREAGLHVGDMSRVDALLKAYDEVLQNPPISPAVRATLDEYEKLVNELKNRPIITLAEIQAQEEDSEHLADFEHGGEQ
jgi:hypothetical protein